MIDQVKGWIIKLLLAYLLIGAIYYLSGFVWNKIVGKQIIFSPIVGLPLSLLGWPQMLYADFVHIEALGVKPYSVLTLVVIIIIMLVLIRQAVEQIK